MFFGQFRKYFSKYALWAQFTTSSSCSLFFVLYVQHATVDAQTVTSWMPTTMTLRSARSNRAACLFRIHPGLFKMEAGLLRMGLCAPNRAACLFEKHPGLFKIEASSSRIVLVRTYAADDEGSKATRRHKKQQPTWGQQPPQQLLDAIMNERYGPICRCHVKGEWAF